MTDTALTRNNVQVLGRGPKTLMFVHGFGCDQNVWRHVVPAFAEDWKIVLLDLTGAGKSDLSAYNRAKYRTLDGHVTDILEICEVLALTDVAFVGHSVGAMIGVLAANRAPRQFASLLMVGPSPCYINDGDYVGGFDREDVDGLLEFLESNFIGWSTAMAPVFMGVPDRPDLDEELTNNFCRTDPDIARHFARATFLSDHREDVGKLRHPSLILQCTADAVAPIAVGEWLHVHIPDSRLVMMRATGHCPHLSAPAETIASMRSFLA